MSAKAGFAEQVMNRPPQPPVVVPIHEEEVREAMRREREARISPAMLTICLKNGDEILLAYALLRRARKCGGGKRWELVFDDCTVIIIGRNLGDKLRDMLRHHRLMLLQEGNVIEGELTPDDGAFISSIELQEADQ